MADSHVETAHDYVHGEMDVSAQSQTFDLFIAMTKWCSLAVSVVVVFLVVWFAVGAGFIPAFVASLVVAVAGFFMLRSKPAQDH